MAKYYPDEEEIVESEPEKEAPEVIVEKHGGLLSKLVAVIIGIVIGIAGTIGGVVGAGFFVMSKPVDDTVRLVDGYISADVYSLVFGEEGADGTRADGYISDKYAHEKIGTLLGDMSKALFNIAQDHGTLSDLTEISPKVDSAVREFLRIAYKNYGVDINKDEFMNTSLSKMPDFLSKTIYGSPVGDILVHFTDLKNSPMMMALCYGEKGIDYVLDENNEVVMLGDSKKRTLNDLKDHSDELFNAIALCDLMTIDRSSNIMMYLAYGKKDVHYTINSDDEVVMLQKRIGILNNVAYNAYGEPMPGTLSGMTYTDADGTTKYLLTDIVTDEHDNPVEVRTTDCEGYATMYYVTDEENNPVIYGHTTFGDIAGGGEVIKNITDRLTIGEILDEETINDNRFLKHVTGETIATLPDAIERLSIQDVFADQVYKTDASGEFILDGAGNKILNGEWWYLLTEGGVEQQYNITQMDKLIDNMRANIETAPLQKLKDDGMITALSQESLNQELRSSVAGVSLPVPAGKSTLGEMTVLEMLDYVDQCLQAIKDVP